MHKKLWMIMFVFTLILVAGCADDTNDSLGNDNELLMIDVAFDPPEKVEVGETILLEATVTQGDELIVDADDVNFEYWIGDNRDDSITIDATNHGDGTYTAEISLDEDGIFTMYAHVTARTMHTMPKRSVTVGTGESAEDESTDEEL